jgi:hypothetical protein
MKLARIIVCLAALLLALQPAYAGGYGKYRGHGGYGGHYGHHSYYRHGYKRHHGHGDEWAIALGALTIGVLTGVLLSRPPPPRPVAVAYPAVPYGFTDCRPTTGTAYYQGRPAEFLGTWCRDPAGRAYVLNDSVRFLRFLD